MEEDFPRERCGGLRGASGGAQKSEQTMNIDLEHSRIEDIALPEVLLHSFWPGLAIWAVLYVSDYTRPKPLLLRRRG
jgi:hypothetical protein